MSIETEAASSSQFSRTNKRQHGAPPGPCEPRSIVRGLRHEAAVAPEDLLQAPDIAVLTLTTPELASVPWSELPTPLRDGLIGDDDATLREELLLKLTVPLAVSPAQ